MNREEEREKSPLGVLIKGLQCSRCGTKLVRDLEELDEHGDECPEYRDRGLQKQDGQKQTELAGVNDG